MRDPQPSSLSSVCLRHYMRELHTSSLQVYAKQPAQLGQLLPFSQSLPWHSSFLQLTANCTTPRFQCLPSGQLSTCCPDPLAAHCKQSTKYASEYASSRGVQLTSDSENRHQNQYLLPSEKKLFLKNVSTKPSSFFDIKITLDNAKRIDFTRIQICADSNLYQ